MKSIFKWLLICTTISVLFGCATPANKQAMSISASDMTGTKSAALKNAVVVRNTSGGKSTNPLWTSQVDNEGFKGALEQSLAIVGYKAADPTTARYVVDVELKKIDQPIFGGAFTVPSNVVYTVSDGSTIKTFPINAAGTAKFSDHWVGVERLRLATEKSVKENIREFINQISSSFME